MKKIIFTLPLIFATLGVQGQNSDKFTGALLWKITGNGLESPCYIFGTHHLADTAFAESYPGLLEALIGAVQVVGEIEMSEMATAQNAMMMHAAMPAGTTYRSLLSPADYERLDALLKDQIGAGLDQIGNFKPAMISNIIAMRLMSEAMPAYNPLTHVSIDQYVQDKGKANGAKVLGLETANDQIRALFYADPLETQAQALICSLGEMKHGKESVLKLNEVYAAGDLFGAYEMAFDDPENPCPMSEESAAALNKDRNDKWIDQLPGIFADGPAFVAVGMLHLCGEEGLLCRLDRLGYAVEAMR